MEVRSITLKEAIQFEKIQSIAFLFKKDFSKYDQHPETFQYIYENVRAVFDDNGKMCAGTLMIPCSVRFDGNTVLMGTIGGVATLPEERRKGYIKNVFESCFEEMYENGYVFSYLYPFSYKFYRQFGYELNMTETEYVLPFTELKQFKQNGTIQMYVPGMDTSVITSIYRNFSEGTNLSAIRTEKHWKRMLTTDPYAKNILLYVWYNQSGTAEGYCQFSIDSSKQNQDLPDMRINEFFWLSKEALTGMLSFLYNFSSQFHNLIIRVPHYIDILPFFREQAEMNQKIVDHGMNRVINVQKSLELMRVPSGNGELTIEVNDNFFPINTGKYLFIWENGKSLVTKIPETAKSNLICDVNTFSQLVTGYTTPIQLHNAGKIEVTSEMEKLNKLFTKTKLLLYEFF